MRGNHEAPSEFPFSSHDLPYNIQDRFGSSFAKAIYGKILALFKLMTLATVIKDRLFLVHGGLPTGVVTSDDYKSSSTILGGWKQAIATARQNHLQNSIMAELLWNDPRTLEGLEPWEPSSRGIGRHFGSKITERWLRATNTRVVVRGHEPCQGYRIDHQGKIMTLFSCTQAYSNISSAGYILASKKDIDLVNNAYDLSKFVRKIPRE
jgi:protein phosphatase